MAELENRIPPGFADLDSEFGDIPTPSESRQQADEAFRNSSDTRARSQRAGADDTESLEDIVNGGNADELQALSERQLSPEAERTFNNLCESKFGVTADELRLQFAKAIDVEQSAREITEASVFMSRHPEYTATPQNSDRLLGFIQSKGIPLSADSLDYAFDVLSKQGALEGIGDQSRQSPHVGLSDRVGTRQDYSGNDRPSFDTEGFRTLSSGARRQYVNAVEHAERNGLRIPTVSEFKKQYRSSPVD